MNSYTYDIWLAALCVWRESRGSSLAAMTAINWVIKNRVGDIQRRWPRTISGVITQPKQFSSFNANDPNSTKFPVEPANHINPSPDWTAWLQAQTAVTAQPGVDPIMGRNGYDSFPADSPLPDYVDTTQPVITISPFRFYFVK